VLAVGLHLLWLDVVHHEYVDHETRRGPKILFKDRGEI
jgi:hypothetical protein